MSHHTGFISVLIVCTTCFGQLDCHCQVAMYTNVVQNYRTVTVSNLFVRFQVFMAGSVDIVIWVVNIVWSCK
jgi:hypothetical protein